MAIKRTGTLRDPKATKCLKCGMKAENIAAAVIRSTGRSGKVERISGRAGADFRTLQNERNRRKISAKSK